MNAKLAYTIPELSEATGVGRTRLYEEIKAGRLKISKCGQRTIITNDQAQAWLSALAGANAEAVA
jgi:excisionase family DNA binding protein